MDLLLKKVGENNIKITETNVDLIIYVLKEIEIVLQNNIENKLLEKNNELKLNELVYEKTFEYEKKNKNNMKDINYLKIENENLQQKILSQNKIMNEMEEKKYKEFEEKEKFIERNYNKIITLKDTQIKELKNKSSKDLEEFLNKHNSKKANDRGDIGENNLNLICNKPLVCTIHGSEKSKCGDGYIYNPENNKIKIMVESKNYGQKTSLPAKEIEKFKRDLEEDTNCNLGIFISWGKKINYEKIEHGEIHKYNDKYALYLSGEQANVNNLELKIFIDLFYKIAEILYYKKHNGINNLENVWKVSLNKINDKVFNVKEINSNLKKQIEGLEKIIKNLRKVLNDNNNFANDIDEIISQSLIESDFECDNDCGFSGTFDVVNEHEKTCCT